MGLFDFLGTSTQQQTQNSSTNPWLPAQPLLNGILGQTQGQIGNTGLTAQEGGALNSMEYNGQNATDQYAPRIAANATDLLTGGGALNQAGNVNQNYQNYYNQTNPLASNTNYNPYNTPGFSDAINTLGSDITNQVNGSFAGAGRDFSGANQMALGRGLTQGLAPTIAAQYNQNVQNQQGAAGNLFAGGNTSASLLTGLQQQYLQNKQLGTQAASDAMTAQNAGANATLQAEAARRGIPVQALGLLAQIGIPIAGLGGQSTGQSNTTSTASPAAVFGGLFGGGAGNSAVSNAFKMFSDRRMKEDITQVGALFDGTPVYRFRYIGHPAFQIGLMAQDVEKTTPEAVEQIGAFKAVDYKLATDKAVEAA